LKINRTMLKKASSWRAAIDPREVRLILLLV